MRLASRDRDIFINGRFVTQRTTGVQRFAWEVVHAVDLELREGKSELANRNWTLVVPAEPPPGISLQRIAVRVVGGASGHLWDQLVLARAARSGIVVNLTNGGPLVHPRSVVIIHDAGVFRTPGNYTRRYVLLHRLLGSCLARTSRVGTVSEFSRRELAAIFRMDGSRIFIVPNSCEHLRGIVPDETVLTRLGLVAGRYFLCVGKPSANKNLTTAIAAFARLGPSHKFVMVGMADRAVFRKVIDHVPAGVIVTGHLSDRELAAVFRGATALIFPSLYEGFGIPPLEGMVSGCPVIASRIPPVEEVCGDAALYFDPTNISSLHAAMQSIVEQPELRASLVSKGAERAQMFSWRRSAQQLMSAISNVE